MRNFCFISKSTRTVLALAFGCSAINCLGSFTIGASAWPDLGNILLFLAVGALSATGAIVAASISTLIEVTLFPERIDMLRIVFLVSGASLLLRAFPRMPLFASVGLLWLGTLSPTLTGFHHTNQIELAWSNESLMLMGMWDVLLATCAGLALLNPVIWGLVSGKPRHLPLQQVLTHAIAGATLFPLIGAVLLLGLDRFMRTPEAATNILALVAFSLLLSTWLAERVSLLFADNTSPLLQSSNGNGRRFKTMSNLAADVWQEGGKLWEHGAERSVPEHTMTRSRAVLASSRGRDLGICALSRNGTVGFMNDKFRELASVTTPEPAGRMLSGLALDARVSQQISELIEESFAKGTNCSKEIRLNQLPDRLTFLSISCELGHQRSTIDAQSIIVTIEDITTRRTVGYDLILAQRKDSLQTLISGMGHALNNALTSVAGNASTARRCEDPFKLDYSLDAVVRSSKEAGVLISQLLEFSNARSYAPKGERLERLLKSHQQVLAGIGGEGCDVRFTVPKSSFPVSCDAGLILLAITNLVINARDSYGAEAGSIQVSLNEETLSDDAPQILPGSRPGHFARIQVSDTGQGMSPEVLRHTLNPETYQHSTSAGPGLALATAYAIIRAHDGFLTAESHQERGTTISLYLPLQKFVEEEDSPQKPSRTIDSLDAGSRTASVKPETPRAPSGSQESPVKKGSILVVEDDDTIREVVRSMLSTLGYSVQACSDGSQALSFFSKTKFDLVLVDLVMPKMYGLEVIEQLRRIHPDVPTLLMTGSGHLVSSESSDIRLLPKPFDIETLEQVVQESLKASSMSPSSQSASELLVPSELLH